MANRILVEEGWEERIRGEIGVDEPYLPDSVIQQPENITIAEANIIEQVPDYSSLTGDKKVYLEAAVVCECARLICSGMSARLPKREQGPHAAHEVNIDWDKMKAGFEAERDGYIVKILPPFPTLLHFGLSQ